MKGLIIAIVIIGILIIGLVGFSLFSNSKSINKTSKEELNPEINEPTSIIEEESIPQETIHKLKNYNVEIRNFAFSPKELKIKVGDSITWTNLDSTKHTVTSDSGNELNSELLAKEETYSYTFNKKGTFEYHCKPHPYMTAKIIVE